MGDLDGVLNESLGHEMDTLGIDLGKMECLSAGMLQDRSLQQHISTSGKPLGSFSQWVECQAGRRAGHAVRKAR